MQVSVEEENDYKKITIKKILEDGTIDIIHWEGTGETPEDIAKEFGPGDGIIVIEEDSGRMQLDDSEKVLKKTVRVIVDENGRELDRQDRKKIKVIVEQDGDQQEVVIIEMEDGKQEKIIIDEASPLPEVPKIERSLKLKGFQVYPNPASERINLQFKAKKAPVTIRVFDAAGREVYKEFQREFDGNYQNQIELENISADFFFVSIEQRGKVYTEKVIQQQ